MLSQNPAPIGVFDSGYGGLTVFRDIVQRLPDYDYMYLGDNARAPYGTRDFDTIYQYTLEAVNYLFRQGCHLIILACNTASAKALRSIQQNDLPHIDPTRRVLGVIRPTAEQIGQFSTNGKVGILATRGTVVSNSYPIEIGHFSPEVKVYQQACPLWVPLVENNEHEAPGADYFVQKYLVALLEQDPDIDTLVLGCTHYPLLLNKINQFLPAGIQVVAQGQIVASSLAHYLERHPEMAVKCSKNSQIRFLTTESASDFEEKASIFLGRPVSATHVSL